MKHLDRPDRPRIACHHHDGRAPTIVFLPGYASDMSGTKAVAIEEWARREGRAMLRFDYAGCGASEGAFEDQSLADWTDDALAVIDGVEGPVVLVGSSMGGWVMLLAALARPGRIAGLVGIAAAPDFTSWGFTDAQKAALKTEGRIEEPSEYSDQPTVTTLRFWEAGEANLLLDAPIAIDVPVRLLHGQRDPDVPWRHALTLAEQLAGDDVQTWLIKDGDHRLSRAPDIALIVAAIRDVSGDLV